MSDKDVRTLTGKVVSDKMDQTISVAISRVVKHPVYGTIPPAHFEGARARSGECR